jgi:hypothetical protein
MYKEILTKTEWKYFFPVLNCAPCYEGICRNEGADASRLFFYTTSTSIWVVGEFGACVRRPLYPLVQTSSIHWIRRVGGFQSPYCRGKKRNTSQINDWLPKP